MNPFTAAVVQAAPVAFDRERTLEKLADLAADAARAGARLAVFPEAFVSAYPHGSDFGARVGFRSPEGRELFRRYFDSAVQIPSPATEALGQVARDNGLELVVGVIERDGGTLYCTILFFGPDGAYRGKHRKLMPTAMERLIWGQGDGSTIPVLDTALGKLGAVICWENYMPLLRAAMYARGVQLYCAPTVEDRLTWTASMQHIAIEGRCFVLSAVQFARRADFPKDYQCADGDDPQTLLIGGGSAIVSPYGELLAGPDRDGEAVLTAEIDLDEIIRGKYDLDTVGHYSRPDVFRLIVDETPRPPIITTRRRDGEDEG